MTADVALDAPLTWRQVAAVAEGAALILPGAALGRIERARDLVEAIVSQGILAYGVNTGVGALCNVVVAPSQLKQLSRNIVMSHAVGMGEALGRCEVRAIIAAAINNFAHGVSGVRPLVVDGLNRLLTYDCLPEVPAHGSVGYLSHMAHIALTLLGEGEVRLKGRRMPSAAALASLDWQPLVLDAKEGLSLVNGTPCATGLTAVALLRSERLLNWADVISAMSFENLQGQLSAFDPDVLQLRASQTLSDVGMRLTRMLQDSALLRASAGRRTQDPLSLRAIPQVHGAARDVFAGTAAVVDAELAAATDNPSVLGTPEAPRAASQAHAVGAALALAADSLAIAMAELAAMSERRIDRLVNPLVSGLPAFLASDSGTGSGFMIAQYAAVALVGENRRLAQPASLDGGITSALQEDHLSHATPAALKLLSLLDNVERIFCIELLAAAQAYDLQGGHLARAPSTDIVYRAVRSRVRHYRDDRPLAEDVERIRTLLREPSGGDAAELDGAGEAAPLKPPRRARAAPRQALKPN